MSKTFRNRPTYAIVRGRVLSDGRWYSLTRNRALFHSFLMQLSSNEKLCWMSRPCLCSLYFNLEYGPGYVFDTVLVLKLQQLRCNCLLAPLPSSPCWGWFLLFISRPGVSFAIFWASRICLLLCEVTIWWQSMKVPWTLPLICFSWVSVSSLAWASRQVRADQTRMER